MNQRERILAISVLSVVIAAVGGFLFKWLFLDNLNRIYADVETTKAEIVKKEAELQKEQDDEKALLRDDPRLVQWQKLSLPDDKNLEAEVKSGRTVEEAKKRHEDMVQVDYSHFLNDLVVKSGFSPNSIKVSSAGADRKGGPILTGKTPAYTRMTFTIQAQGGLDSVQRMLEDFHKTPLLQQIRNLTLTARTPARTTAPAGPPGAVPVRVPGAPGGAAGFAGGFGAASANGDLDVSMTVEALLVVGAQKRDELLPKSSDVSQVQTLAAASDEGNKTELKGREYSDILVKNIFTGIAAKTQLSEERDSVLSAVRLTSIWNDDGRRWQATIYDQGKGGDETHLRPKILRDGTAVLNEFSVADAYNNVLVRAKVIKLDADGMVFEADGKTYRWQVGQYLGRRANANAPADSDASPQYIPGVLDAPLTSDDLKGLGLNK